MNKKVFSDLKNQITLGRLIEALDENSENLVVWTKKDEDDENPLVMSDNGVGSYRGYYDHIAIEFEEDDKTFPPATESELYDQLTVFREGETMTGYKGGEYLIEDKCPVWLSTWGEVSDLFVVGVERRNDLLVLVCDVDGDKDD